MSTHVRCTVVPDALLPLCRCCFRGWWCRNKGKQGDCERKCISGSSLQKGLGSSQQQILEGNSLHMGCSQSALCVATLSQQDAPGSTQQQQPGLGLTKQRSMKLPPVRTFEADPAKAQQSAAERHEATEAAQAMLLANEGVNYRDTYIRATLVSYGGSCRVFTAVNKHSHEPVAIKTITKVGTGWPDYLPM